MKMQPEKFMATHTGRCATCGDEGTLDSMLRKSDEKGLYECKECHTGTFDDVTLYGEMKGVVSSVVPNMTALDARKTKRLFSWCFG